MQFLGVKTNIILELGDLGVGGYDPRILVEFLGVEANIILEPGDLGVGAIASPQVLSPQD